MKLGTIVAPKFTEALGKLIKTELPVVAAYKLKKVASIVNEEQKKFEDVRSGLVTKHAKKNKKGEIVKDENGGYSVDKENMKDFLKEIEDLLAVEVEIPKLKLSELGDNLKMTAQEMVLLDGLLEE
ncbi:MAG: hypothetical protein EBU90_24970, partial [Proteobacteria bacterium]|nr:hypothetical protein [Pseudomonadota bacterium]